MNSQVDVKSSASLQNCEWWPNRFASRAHKFTQVGNFFKFHPTILLTCDQLVSTCVGWPNGGKLASTCIRIWARPKSTQIIASGWPNETQVELKSQTCVDLPLQCKQGSFQWLEWWTAVSPIVTEMVRILMPVFLGTYYKALLDTVSHSFTCSTREPCINLMQNNQNTMQEN